MSRPELLERYQAIPLPTKSDEHWRFTDLAGFDPDSFTAAGAADASSGATMLEIDASGVAFVGETGITIENAPAGIRFEHLTDDHPLLGTLVGHGGRRLALDVQFLNRPGRRVRRGLGHLQMLGALGRKRHHDANRLGRVALCACTFREDGADQRCCGNPCHD